MCPLRLFIRRWHGNHAGCSVLTLTVARTVLGSVSRSGSSSSTLPGCCLLVSAERSRELLLVAAASRLELEMTSRGPGDRRPGRSRAGTGSGSWLARMVLMEPGGRGPARLLGTVLLTSPAPPGPAMPGSSMAGATVLVTRSTTPPHRIELRSMVSGAQLSPHSAGGVVARVSVSRRQICSPLMSVMLV